MQSEGHRPAQSASAGGKSKLSNNQKKNHAPADKPHSAVINTRIDALAELSEAEYERTRKGVAKRLRVRLEFLDKQVRERRHELEDEHDAPSFAQPVRLWPEAIDGSELLGELIETLKRHLVLAEALAVALWIMFAHSHDGWQHSPYLWITSPTKRCGKTNLIKLLSKLVPKSLSTSNATGPSIFHVVDRYHPTLLIDEADTWASLSGETRGILNSGHDRSGATVLRFKRLCSTWAPKAIALIGRLPGTLEDRSIKIEMKRKLLTENLAKIPNDPGAFRDLRQKCARWAKDNLAALGLASPRMPKLNDRACDNWVPLLSIAEACGGNWPIRARNAARRISLTHADEDPVELLLQDIRQLFERERVDQVSGETVIRYLEQLEDRPWAQFHRGAPITKHAVAKLLKPFGIGPVQVSVDGRRPNGYRLEQFKEEWRRYLSDLSGRREASREA
jgi:Protein of unknown function (DUF3631)